MTPKRTAGAVLHCLLWHYQPTRGVCHRHHRQTGGRGYRSKDQLLLGGSQGGGQQIASRIACNEIDLLIFFRDPLTAKPHEPNDSDLLRLCDVHNIPFATNIATAEALIRGVERGDFEWREIVNPKYNH